MRVAGGYFRPPVPGTSAPTPDPEGAARRAGACGSCSPPRPGGSVAHARCSEACFPSVTTGELGFFFSLFVPFRGRRRARGGRREHGGSLPAAGLAEERSGAAGGPRAGPGIPGPACPGSQLRPSLGSRASAWPLPWSRAGAGAGQVSGAGPGSPGRCGAAGEAAFIGASTPGPPGMLGRAGPRPAAWKTSRGPGGTFVLLRGSPGLLPPGSPGLPPLWHFSRPWGTAQGRGILCLLGSTRPSW